MSGRVTAVEALYEAVVTDPSSWNEQMFVDWSESVVADGPVSKDEAKYVRRALRMAQKLRAFWIDAPVRRDLGWESRVDLALGPRAWRPVLDLAEAQLRNSRSEEAFTDVANLFPLVNGEKFLDGMNFDDWRDSQS
jgi:hypothetical protein